EVDHQEDLVEYGPEPRYPDALEAIDEEEVHHPHRPADVEHTRSVGQPEHVPRQLISSQEVVANASGSPPRDPEPDGDRRQNVDPNDEQVDEVERHGESSGYWLLATGCWLLAGNEIRSQQPIANGQ